MVRYREFLYPDSGTSNTGTTGFATVAFPLELNCAIELAVEKMGDEQGELTLWRSGDYQGFFFVRYNGVLNKVSPSDIAFVKVEGK